MQDPIVPPVPVATVSSVPRSEIDLSKVALYSSGIWATRPEITLIYITSADFAVKASNFSQLVTSSKTQTGSRSPKVRQLKVLDKEIDNHLKFLKSYINEIYLNNADSYYSTYGMEYNSHSGYNLPKDRDERVEALHRMVTALNTAPFKDRDFGYNYWLGIRDNYTQLLDDVKDISGGISETVGNKGLLKKEIKKVLNSLIHVIKGNYPDTYREELRTWGFQKEKY